MTTLFAQGSRATLALIPEVTFGVTPTTPALVGLPISAHSLDLTRSDFDDPTIRADRMVESEIDGTRAAAGDIDVQFGHSAFDALLAAGMSSVWTTNTTSTGVLQTSFTIEAGQTDIGSYTSYTGCVVDKMAIVVPVSGPVTAKFSMLAKDGQFGTATIGTSTSAPVQYQPYTHITGSILVNGVAVTTFSNLEIDIDNGYSANMVLGSPTAAAMSYGMMNITGTFTTYFADNSLLTMFRAGTHFALSCQVSDGTNTHTFLVPNAKITAASKPVKDGTSNVTVDYTFRAIKDPTTHVDLLITRSS